jgi:ATP-dependent Clp protease ATP-binding subunit ClpC
MSDTLSGLIVRSAQEARGLGHGYVGTVHLVIDLSRSGGFGGLLLRSYGGEPGILRRLAAALWGRGTGNLPLRQGMTGQLRRVLRDSGREARLTGAREPSGVHLLMALSRREGCAGMELLELLGMSRDRLFSACVETVLWEGRAPSKGKKEAAPMKLLEQFSEDMIAKAGAMEPVIGRDREIETVIGILSRKHKNNPALVG